MLVLVAGIAVLGLFIIFIIGELATTPGTALSSTGSGIGNFFSNMWNGISKIWGGSGNTGSNSEGLN